MFFQKIPVAIVEDTRLFAEMAKLLISQDRRCELAGIARTQAEGTMLCRTTRPKVAIVDWMLEDGDGISLINALKDELPETRWLVATAYNCSDLVEFAASAGAHGIIDKTTAGFDDLKEAIRALAKGGEYYCPASSKLMAHVIRRPEDAELSEQQRRILKMLARHMTRLEIARKLDVEPSSITQQIARIAKKLNFDNRPSMSVMIPAARAAGLLPNVPVDHSE